MGKILLKVFLWSLLPALLCMMFLGGGHGTIKPYAVIFPGPLYAGLNSKSEAVIVILTLAQFPLYALVLLKSPKKTIAAALLITLHISLAVLCFSTFLSASSNYR